MKNKADKELVELVKKLLKVINQDDEGDFFICKEAESEIKNLEDYLKNNK